MSAGPAELVIGTRFLTFQTAEGMNTPIHTYCRSPSNVVPIGSATFGTLGTWSARELKRILDEKLGPMRFVRFDEPDRIAPGVMIWRGVHESAGPIRGELALRAALLHSDEVVTGVEITVMPTQAERVARRASKSAGGLLVTRPVRGIEVTYSDGGIVTSRDCARLIEPHVGQVMNLTFRKSLTGLPNTVAWEALHSDGIIITGALVLHAAVRGNQVVSWAEVQVDKPVGRFATRKAAAPGRDTQLESIARMGRDLIRQLRENPKMPTWQVVGEIVAMVDEAETAIDWSADLRSVPARARGANRNGTGRG